MHYTKEQFYKAISSQKDWKFVASQPQGDNKFGAYFTTLPPDAPRFSARTRISKIKQVRVFAFSGAKGLQPKEGGKGAYIFWSPTDYVVEGNADEKHNRQQYHGASETLP